MDSNAEKIAKLNDEFRKKAGQGALVSLTPGIKSLPIADQYEVFSLIRTFNDFSENNNPYGERDFGAINYKENRIFWKIDYYDKSMKCGSDAPYDPEKTTRVMTVMMAHEY